MMAKVTKGRESEWEQGRKECSKYNIMKICTLCHIKKTVRMIYLWYYFKWVALTLSHSLYIVMHRKTEALNWT